MEKARQILLIKLKRDKREGLKLNNKMGVKMR